MIGAAHVFLVAHPSCGLGVVFQHPARLWRYHFSTSGLAASLQTNSNLLQVNSDPTAAEFTHFHRLCVFYLCFSGGKWRDIGGIWWDSTGQRRRYPGLVRAEKVMEAAPWLDLTNSESPEFIGRAVAALAADPDIMRHTGTVLVAASVAAEYGFTDIDGKTPRPLTLADV